MATVFHCQLPLLLNIVYCLYVCAFRSEDAKNLRKTCSRILVVKFAGDILYSSPVLLRTLPRSTKIYSTNLCGPRVPRVIWPTRASTKRAKTKLQNMNWTKLNNLRTDIAEKVILLIIPLFSKSYVPIKTTEAMLYVV